MNPTDPTENYSAGPPPWEPQPPKRKRHLIRNILLSIAGVFIAFGILLAGLGALAGSPSHSTGTAVGSSSPAPAATTTPPPASPDPKGTDTGSCDYQLGSDPVGGTAKAVGEIDVTNTGNVGIVVRTVITWPQEGFAPLLMHKRARVPVGGTVPVSFNRPLSYDQITALQSWQTGHNFADGCTYKVTIIDTYGPVQGG